MFLEMKVHSVAVDPLSNVPIIILKDLQEGRTLPIWIGTLEANSITAHLESKITSRPMTHDIMAQILEKMNTRVVKIEITDLKSNVYYASIHIESGGNVFKVDSRPSDAIALALRSNSPIMVEEKVIEKSMEIKIEGVSEESDLNPDELLEMLDELSIEDLGKYKM